MTNIICSTTQSVWTNRASHAVKVSLATMLALSVFSRIKPSAHTLKWGVVASNLSFAAPWFVGTVMFSVYPHDAPLTYNGFFDRIWGGPETKRVGLQFPLFTGIEIAALMTCGVKSRWARAAALVGLAIRSKALWGPLSHRTCYQYKHLPIHIVSWFTNLIFCDVQGGGERLPTIVVSRGNGLEWPLALAAGSRSPHAQVIWKQA